MLTHFQPVFHFYTPTNNRNLNVFWCFQEVYKLNIGWKWVHNHLQKSLFDTKMVQILLFSIFSQEILYRKRKIVGEIDAKLLIWQLWKCGKDHKGHKSSLFSYQKHKRRKYQVITFIVKKLLNRKYVIMFRVFGKKHVEKC